MAYEGVNAAGQAFVLPVPAQPGLGGTPGRDGEDGANGLSAYQIAKAAGFPGTERDFANQLLARAAGVFARTAATRIPARRMVVDLGNGQCGVVDPTDPTQAGLVLGIVLQDTAAGAQVTAQQGELGSAVQFAFGAAGPLYIADDGSLTLTPRTTGFSQIVGWTPDGVTAVIALGQARPLVSLDGGVTVPSGLPQKVRRDLGLPLVPGDPGFLVAMEALYDAWVSSLPVWSGDGPAPVASGKYYRQGPGGPPLKAQ